MIFNNALNLKSKNELFLYMTDARATSIESLQNQGELVHNVEEKYQQMSSSEEESDMNDTKYNHQMDNDINESFASDNSSPSQNVQPAPSMTSNLISGLKSPVIVLVLFVILNLKIVRTVTLTLLSKVISPDNVLTETASVVLRGLVCAILFFVITRFV